MKEKEINAEILLSRINPDLYRVWKAMNVIFNGEGNGSIEIHFLKRRIRMKNGLYIKPSFQLKEEELIVNNIDKENKV